MANSIPIKTPFGMSLDPSQLGMSLQGSMPQLQAAAPLSNAQQPQLQQAAPASAFTGPVRPQTQIQQPRAPLQQLQIQVPVNKQAETQRMISKIEAVRGQAPDDVILNQLIEQNKQAHPDRIAKIQAAMEGGWDATRIIDGIIEQNAEPVEQKVDRGFQNTDSTGTDILTNALTHAVDLGKGVYNMARHPIDTASSLKDLALASILPKTAGGDLSDAENGVQQVYPQAQAIQEAIAKRTFGGATDVTPTMPFSESVNRAKDQLVHDPVGFGLDASTLLSAGGGLASGTGGISKMTFGKGDALVNTGKALESASNAVNPVNIAAKGAGLVLPSQKKLESANLRLTSLQKTKLKKDYTDAVDLIGKHIPAGTPHGRLASATNMADDIETVLQSTLDDPKLSVVAGQLPKKDLLARLEKIPDKFRDNLPMYQMSKNRVNDIMKTIDEISPDTIPIPTINAQKRGFWNVSYNDLGILKTNKDIEKAIGDVFQTEVEGALNKTNIQVLIPKELQKLFGASKLPVKEFNKQYGKLLSAKNMLEAVAEKPQAGLAGRAGAALAGNAVARSMGGGEVLSTLAALGSEHIADKSSTLIRSALGKTAANLKKVGGGTTLGKAAQITRLLKNER